MIYNVNELRKDTAALIKDIEIQITAVKKKAEAMGIEPQEYRTPDGRWVMPPLLQAKATAYNTLVLLQISSPTARPAPGSTRRG